MRNRIFILLALVFAFLQGPLLPSVFIEGLLVIMLINANPSATAARGEPSLRASSLVTLFLAGIIFDLIQGRTLGITAVLFGAFALLSLLLSRAASFKRTLPLSSLAFFVDIVRGKIVFGQYFFVPAVVCFLIVYLILRFVSRPGEHRVFRYYG